MACWSSQPPARAPSCWFILRHFLDGRGATLMLTWIIHFHVYTGFDIHCFFLWIWCDKFCQESWKTLDHRWFCKSDNRGKYPLKPKSRSQTGLLVKRMSRNYDLGYSLRLVGFHCPKYVGHPREHLRVQVVLSRNLAATVSLECFLLFLFGLMTVFRPSVTKSGRSYGVMSASSLSWGTPPLAGWSPPG